MNKTIQIHNKRQEFELGSRFQILVTADVEFEITGFEPPTRFYPGWPGTCDVISINPIRFTSDGIDRDVSSDKWLTEYLSRFKNDEKLIDDLLESLRWNP